MYSVMWSEHCSYKSSKIHFSLWGENTTDEMREKLLVGIGENAGVVDIGDGWAVTFKVESHNHPSYVEPYQGAATGVGGIIRDIMSMGARPIAVMDPLRFGNLLPPRHPARPAGGRRRRRRLRQLHRPAQHRWRGRLRRLLPGQPPRQRPLRRRDARRGHPPRQGLRGRQQGDPLRRPHRWRRHRRGVGARLRDVRRGWPDQAPRGAGRRPVRREGAHRVLSRPVCRWRRRRHPGPRRCWALLRDERARVQR